MPIIHDLRLLTAIWNSRVSLSNVRSMGPYGSKFIDGHTRNRIFTLYDVQNLLLKEFTELGAVQANNGIPHPRYLADAILQLHMESIPRSELRQYIYDDESMFLWLTGQKQFYVPNLLENSKCNVYN